MKARNPKEGKSRKKGGDIVKKLTEEKGKIEPASQVIEECVNGKTDLVQKKRIGGGTSGKIPWKETKGGSQKDDEGRH